MNEKNQSTPNLCKLFRSNEAGEDDYGQYWTITTHLDGRTWNNTKTDEEMNKELIFILFNNSIQAGRRL